MSDMKTTEGVLAWFRAEGWYVRYPVTETAARLALAMRVLEIVEEQINDDWTMTYGGYKDGPSEWDKGFNKGMDWMLELGQDIFSEAVKGEGK